MIGAMSWRGRNDLAPNFSAEGDFAAEALMLRLPDMTLAQQSVKATTKIAVAPDAALGVSGQADLGFVLLEIKGQDGSHLLRLAEAEMRQVDIGKDGVISVPALQFGKTEALAIDPDKWLACAIRNCCIGRKSQTWRTICRRQP